MTGLDLSRAVLAERPGTPVILISGYSGPHRREGQGARDPGGHREAALDRESGEGGARCARRHRSPRRLGTVERWQKIRRGAENAERRLGEK